MRQHVLPLQRVAAGQKYHRAGYNPEDGREDLASFGIITDPPSADSTSSSTSVARDPISLQRIFTILSPKTSSCTRGTFPPGAPTTPRHLTSYRCTTIPVSTETLEPCPALSAGSQLRSPQGTTTPASIRALNVPSTLSDDIRLLQANISMFPGQEADKSAPVRAELAAIADKLSAIAAPSPPEESESLGTVRAATPRHNSRSKGNCNRCSETSRCSEHRKGGRSIDAPRPEPRDPCVSASSTWRTSRPLTDPIGSKIRTMERRELKLSFTWTSDSPRNSSLR